MKIKSFSYIDHLRKWRLEPFQLDPHLNLLVGVSGVGKSMTLDAIYELTRIASGNTANGIEWDIRFELEDLIEYRWCGKFYAEPNSDYAFETPESTPIEFERLERNGIEVFSRKGSDVELESKKTPKIPLDKSVLSVFGREPVLKNIRKAFMSVIKSKRNAAMSYYFFYVGLNGTSYSDIEAIRSSQLPPLGKLYLTTLYAIDYYNEIREHLSEIFPSIEDIRFSLQKVNGQELSNSYALYIREKGCSDWIPGSFVSSGMLQTLIHLAEIYLSPPGSVILIDEFESSLGVNCLDILTEDYVLGVADHQFIITSHHPYIINNIPPENWKIVTRRQGVVSIRDAKEYRIGKEESHHDTFIQLINLPAYQTGMTPS